LLKKYRTSAHYDSYFTGDNFWACVQKQNNKIHTDFGKFKNPKGKRQQAGNVNAY
jgi:hypothetical protein